MIMPALEGAPYTLDPRRLRLRRSSLFTAAGPPSASYPRYRCAGDEGPLRSIVDNVKLVSRSL